MASAIVSSVRWLAGKLAEAIQRNNVPESSSDANRREHIARDLEQLNRLMRRIQAVIQDAEEREIRDRSVQLWLDELRGVAYEAEDVLGEYHYEVLRATVEARNAASEISHEGTKRKLGEECVPSSLASTSSFMSTNILIQDDIAEKIKGIRERFEEISKSREGLCLREEDGERRYTGPQKRPATSSHVDETGIFGREYDKEDVISLLNIENGPEFVVVPIVGMGGLGKTTLAQLVYNDVRISGLFDQRAWVSVSEDFDTTRLTKAIIESITKEPCGLTELNILQDVLKEKLRESKLFLVLDDVWNEKQSLWDSFRVALTSAKKVRILTTSRHASVAKIMQTVPSYQLGYLPEDLCWMLFKNNAFGNLDPNKYMNLVDIGHSIVKKCKRLPLAIRVLGGLLQFEMDEDYWREVLESDIWELQEEKNEILPSLKLSYYHLPLHLRPCFLYLSVFPKDTRYKKDGVVRMWMAQGYIMPRSRKTLEDIGAEYFDELQCRSLLNFFYGRSYVLHDLIHDLARSINVGSLGLENEKQWDISYKVQHLYVEKDNKLLIFSALGNYRAVRTLLYRNVITSCAFISQFTCLRVLEFHIDGSKIPPDTFGNLKHLSYLKLKVYGGELQRPETICLLYNLQTLELECDSLIELPGGIGNLINLRCLRVGGYKIKQLPESICMLHNLQTLEFDFCEKLSELPSGISQLTSLKNLLIYGTTFKCMPPGLGMLSHLQNLHARFFLESDRQKECRELKDLKSLKGNLYILGLENILDAEHVMEMDLKSKHSLKGLYLDWDSDNLELYDPEDFQVHFCLNSARGILDDKEREEAVLENLQPSCNIMELRIVGYGGRKFSSWIFDPTSFSKLTCVAIVNCCTECCSFLPPFGQLPALKFLSIIGVAVEKVGNEFCRNSVSGNTDSTVACTIGFPCLETLELRNMTRWKEWSGVLDGDFPCLEKLLLCDCHELWILPNIPENVMRLEIDTCNIREIRIAPQSKLENMCITSCVDLTSILGNFPRLEKLSLQMCDKLSKLPAIEDDLKILEISCCGLPEIRFPSQSKLSDMCIANCNELTSILGLDGDCPYLKRLSLNSCPKLHNLPPIPKEVKHLEITDCGCHEIRVAHLSKIRDISITKCWELRSILGLYNLSLLENLSLIGCPLLLISLNDMLSSMHNEVHISDCYHIYDCYLRETGSQGNRLNWFQRTTTPLTTHEHLFMMWDDTTDMIVRIDRQSVAFTVSFSALIFTEANPLEEGVLNRLINGVSCQKLMLNMPWLKLLEIYKCPMLTLIAGLNNLASLKELYVKYCPELCHWRDLLLPSSLQSLEVTRCDKLSSLPPIGENLSSLEVLEISNCPRLTVKLDPYRLTSPRSLKLINCLEICVSFADGRQFRLPDGIIAYPKDWHQMEDLPDSQWLRLQSSEPHSTIEEIED